MAPSIRSDERDPDEGAPPAVTRQDYRNAMARLGAAVTIVTTDGPGGRHGFTASAVCSVTDSPPTLLVCLNRGSSASAAIHANGVLCVNTLGGGHEHLSNLFGGRTPPAERFAAGEWKVSATGAPMLLDAVAAFDCRIVRSVEVGTHDVLFCEVVGLAQGGAREGLIYFSRRYHAVVGEPDA
ncbi:flavin reductase [Ancylobacter pratisalsi]|uniref:FMN reductase (NADH) RutF n=1 Tax=Ancylobacter pratisalsi TaxID=1745854 RepID=A0A6P1YN38_9HYPH|nr:flavin reductase [Ancylobacter pratisalsi]QIB34131.1 FMN reductase [Ancylobacter pratisalsi]